VAPHRHSRRRPTLAEPTKRRDRDPGKGQDIRHPENARQDGDKASRSRPEPPKKPAGRAVKRVGASHSSGQADLPAPGQVATMLGRPPPGKKWPDAIWPSNERRKNSWPPARSTRPSVAPDSDRRPPGPVFCAKLDTPTVEEEPSRRRTQRPPNCINAEGIHNQNWPARRTGAAWASTRPGRRGFANRPTLLWEFPVNNAMKGPKRSLGKTRATL